MLIGRIIITDAIVALPPTHTHTQRLLVLLGTTAVHTQLWRL
jgi:hypothetical protein